MRSQPTQGQRVGCRCDRKSRQGDPRQFDTVSPARGPAGGRHPAGQVDHPARPRATGSNGSRRMPRPRTSIRPAKRRRPGAPAGGRSPLRHARGRRATSRRRSGTRAALAARLQQRQRQRDLPRAGRAADQHRARAPTSTAEAWMVGSIALKHRRSHRRQADDEAGAEHRGSSPSCVAARRAVLGPDAAAMRFDDLLGDRKAEPGILAEALLAAGRCRSARRSSPARPAGCRGRRRRRRSRPRSSAAGRSRAPRRRRARTSAHCRSGCRSPGRAAKSWPGTMNAFGSPPSKRQRDR